MRSLVRLTVVALSLALPSGALAAAPTVSPPGNSGISQYLEVVPTASGGKPSKNAHKSDGGSPLSSKQQKKLDAAGSDGQQLSRVVAGTSPTAEPAAPVKKPVKHHKKKKAATTTATTTTATTTTATVTAKGEKSALAAAFTSGGGGSGDGGLGIPLVAPMLAAAAIAGAFAFARRRGSSGDADGLDGTPDA